MATVKNKTGKKECGKTREDSLISQYSRGNVGLQTKRYVTASEKKSRRDKILSVEFS